MRILGLLLVLALAVQADAAPTADLVVVWAPGMRTAPVVAAARQAGAATIDQSPKPEATAQTAQLVTKGLDAFDRGEFDEAWQLLETARSEVDRNGGAGITQAQLSDLFLYRGLIKAEQGDSNNSWEELVVANTVDPTRELDPGRFSPRIRAEFERAQATVKNKGRAKLKVSVPEGCRVFVDSSNAPGPVELIVGRHWVHVMCPDRRPRGEKLELVGGDVTVPLEPILFSPPTDTDLLVQARASGARAFVVAEVRNNVATARLVGLDGKERDRKTVTIGPDNLEPLADAVAMLLAPKAHTPWYKTRWGWGIGGATIAAAIVLPLTILAMQGGDPADINVIPDFKGKSPL